MSRLELPPEPDPDIEAESSEASSPSRFDFDRVQDVGVEMDDTLRIEDELYLVWRWHKEGMVA